MCHRPIADATGAHKENSVPSCIRACPPPSPSSTAQPARPSPNNSRLSVATGLGANETANELYRDTPTNERKIRCIIILA